MSIEQQLKAAMQAAFDHFKEDLKSLRTGRASASVLDKVQVEVYGSHVPLKQLGNVTVPPEGRQILVTPFDVTTLHAISKGIEAANLGLNPMVDGKVVRVPVPPMDENLRKVIVKQCKEHAEKAKVSLREVRRKFNEVARKQKVDGILSEDQLKRVEKQIQESTDRFCKDVDTAYAEKEKQIMTV
jgi:ribosome recycling factor